MWRFDGLGFYTKCLELQQQMKIVQEDETDHDCSSKTCVIARLGTTNVYACLTQTRIAHICEANSEDCPVEESGDLPVCSISGRVISEMPSLDAESCKELIFDGYVSGKLSARDFGTGSDETERARLLELRESMRDKSDDSSREREVFMENAKTLWNTLMFGEKRVAVDKVRQRAVMNGVSIESIRTTNAIYTSSIQSDSPVLAIKSGPKRRATTPRHKVGRQPVSLFALMDIGVRAGDRVRKYLFMDANRRATLDSKYGVFAIVSRESFDIWTLIRDVLKQNGVTEAVFSISDVFIAWLYERDKFARAGNLPVFRRKDAFPLGLDVLLPNSKDLGKIGIFPRHSRNVILRQSLMALYE